MTYTGLADAEVLKSRALHGENVIRPKEKISWWRLWLSKFEDPVIRILLVAACLSLATGFFTREYFESIGILIAVFLATTLAFINEYKAGKEFDSLVSTQDSSPVTVVRNGVYVSIPKKELVKGDIVKISAGMEIPADGTLLESVNMSVDESKFTGESKHVHKKRQDAETEKQMDKKDTAYPVDLLLRGSFICEGEGVMQITSVGESTEIGHIVELASEEQERDTPLKIQLGKLSKLIGVIGFSVALGIFMVIVLKGLFTDVVFADSSTAGLISILVAFILVTANIWIETIYDAFELLRIEKSRPDFLGTKKSWIFSILLAGLVICIGKILVLNDGMFLSQEAFQYLLHALMLAVTIIVVAVPEGLAMSVTLSLAYSMRAMLKDKNLVRRMHACETIGSTGVICCDKTGTLTENKMNVYSLEVDKTNKNESRKNIRKNIIFNSSIAISRDIEKNSASFLGNATECALAEHFWRENRSEFDELSQKKERLSNIHRISFSPDRKFMATIFDNLLFIKGAPEIVLGFSSGKSNSKILKMVEGFQKRGMRTIGFASKLLSKKDLALLKEETIPEEMLSELTWDGFASISDPVRDDVPEAVKNAISAGIDIKMVTGDIEATAVETAKTCGIFSQEDSDNYQNSVIDGRHFSEMEEDKRQSILDSIKVIWRARPLDKRVLVKSLQNKGKVVAVTGDGVNDAPALNTADVGLSMGVTGTDTAKESSDIVILDDSFASIIRAVKWGRGLYLNIQRFILFQLTINLAALTIAFIGPLIGVSLPFTIIQMLWINLIMDTLAALMLASEHPSEKVLKLPPRNPEQFIITPSMKKNIVFTGLLFSIIMIFWLIVRNTNGDPKESTLFFSFFIFLQIWNVLNARVWGTGKKVFEDFFKNKVFLVIFSSIVIVQIAMVQFGGEFFRTVPLSLTEWMFVIFASSPVLLLKIFFNFS